MGLDHGGAHVRVPQQLLHGADVGAALQQVRGEGMAQGVHGYGFGDLLDQPARAPERRHQAPHPRRGDLLPNDGAITRLVGAMMLEQNDEWSLNRRHMQLEGLHSLWDTDPTRLFAVAR